MDDDAVTAALDLVGRAGARELNFGYLHEDVPIDEAGWWATASYQGTKITVENHAGPVEALEGLARRLLTGAKCVTCGGLIALSDSGAIGYPGTIMADGTRWSKEDLEQARHCRWRRNGPRWEPGCPTSYPPEPGDEMHTTEKLALALEELTDPRLASMIRKARAGYYHDFLSPLATPDRQLMLDLRDAGHHELARRVIDGEFDASKAESAAWGKTPEGRAAAAEFMPGGKPVPGSPMASIIDALTAARAPAAQPGTNRAQRRGNGGKPKSSKRGKKKR
jgi:hypothetical protein